MTHSMLPPLIWTRLNYKKKGALHQLRSPPLPGARTSGSPTRTSSLSGGLSTRSWHRCWCRCVYLRAKTIMVLCCASFALTSAEIQLPPVAKAAFGRPILTAIASSLIRIGDARDRSAGLALLATHWLEACWTILSCAADLDDGRTWRRCGFGTIDLGEHHHPCAVSTLCDRRWHLLVDTWARVEVIMAMQFSSKAASISILRALFWAAAGLASRRCLLRCRIHVCIAVSASRGGKLGCFL